MKDPSAQIRKDIYDKLTGSVYYNSSNIPFYDEKVPAEVNPGSFYIILGTQSVNNSSNKTKFVHDSEITIDIVTLFLKDVQKLPADTIANTVMGILQPTVGAGLTDTVDFAFRDFRYTDTTTLSDQFDSEHIIRKILRYRVTAIEI